MGKTVPPELGHLYEIVKVKEVNVPESKIIYWTYCFTNVRGIYFSHIRLDYKT